MKYWIFSILTAALAYCFGNLNTMTLASRFVFRSNLRRLGKGSLWLPNFRRVHGLKGFAKLALVELVKDAIPLLIAGMLFTGGNRELGRALAAFCLILGRMYPAMNGFRGSYAAGALCVSALFINFSLGLAVNFVTLLVTILTRYVSLGTLAGGIALAAVGVLVLDNGVTGKLCFFIALLALFRMIPAILRISSHQEPRVSFEQDISYKFDEEF